MTKAGWDVFQQNVKAESLRERVSLVQFYM